MYLRIEIDVMARLNHPFLVNLNYSFQTPHAAFMVLDLVSGGDLEHFHPDWEDRRLQRLGGACLGAQI